MIVALMCALSGMSYFDRTIMSIAGPVIMKESHISETEMGTVYSAFLLTYALFMGPGGALADRFGARLVLGLGGFLCAVFTGFTALARRLGEFVVVRMAFGVCTAPLYPATGRLSANWIPPSMGAGVQAVIMAGAAVGGAFSPVLFAAMIARFGWRTSFWIAAVLAAVVYGVWYWYVRDYPPEPGPDVPAPQRPEKAQWLQLLKDRNMLLITFSYFCVDYFEYIFFYWIYYYFGEIRHMGKDESAVYVTILMLTMVVMTPFGGWLSDRMVARMGLRRGRRVVPMAGMLLSAILLYVGAGGLGTVATVALLSLSFGFCTSIEGPFWATIIEISGSQVGAACGIMNTGGNLGGILAPTLTPLLAARFGWAAGLYFGSLVILLGLVAWFFIDPSRRVRLAATE
jgi:ACS family glucarate transporter-like MFS transporter